MAKKAVLIGINRYRIPGADLRGCVNDVKNMQSVLTRSYGFKGDDITVLTDFAATKKGIESAIRKLVQGGRKGDVLLVHFSGTARTCPTTTATRPTTGTRSYVRPISTRKNPMRDDWLRKTFDSMRAGVSLTVITDCCHSGTITRAVRPPDARVSNAIFRAPGTLLPSSRAGPARHGQDGTA